MSILQHDIDTGLELRFSEVFDLVRFYGASECNESVAIAKFYNLVGYRPDSIHKDPVGCLEHKFKTLTDMDWAINYTNPERWIDICRSLIRIRPGKTRIVICKRPNSNTYGRDRGPMIYVKLERQGMRKKNHWYTTIEFEVSIREENLGPYIFKTLDVSETYWTTFIIDRDGNLVRVG